MKKLFLVLTISFSITAGIFSCMGPSTNADAPSADTLVADSTIVDTTKVDSTK